MELTKVPERSGCWICQTIHPTPDSAEGGYGDAARDEVGSKRANEHNKQRAGSVRAVEGYARNIHSKIKLLHNPIISVAAK